LISKQNQESGEEKRTRQVIKQLSKENQKSDYPNRTRKVIKKTDQAGDKKKQNKVSEPQKLFYCSKCEKYTLNKKQN
jgi:hypothetical protein